MSIDAASGRVFTGSMDGAENGPAVTEEKSGYTLQDFVDYGSCKLIQDLSVTMDEEKVVIHGRCSFRDNSIAARKAAEQWLEINGLQRSIFLKITSE